MKPVTTARTNHTFRAPPEADDISDLPCRVPEEGSQENVVYSVWEIDEDERAAIAAGANIELGVTWVGLFPPVSLAVTEEQAFGVCDPSGGSHFHGAGDRCECGAEPNVPRVQS